MGAGADPTKAVEPSTQNRASKKYPSGDTLGEKPDSSGVRSGKESASSGVSAVQAKAVGIKRNLKDKREPDAKRLDATTPERPRNQSPANRLEPSSKRVARSPTPTTPVSKQSK